MEQRETSESRVSRNRKNQMILFLLNELLYSIIKKRFWLTPLQKVVLETDKVDWMKPFVTGLKERNHQDGMK